MTDQDMELPVDLLGRIRAQMSSMTKSDQKIAKHLLQAPGDFTLASVRAIAGQIGVSEPTVVRFCRNVGCDGFKDLKFKLTQELAFEQARSDAAAEHPGPDEAAATTPREKRRAPHLSHVLEQANDALASAMETIAGSEALTAAAQAISTSRRIVVFGLGGSSAVMAEELHNRLFRLGLASVCYTDSYAQRMVAATVGEFDIAFFITSTGRPRSLQDSLELARYYGAKTIAITDQETPIGRDADICLNVRLTQAGVHEFQPNPMRFGQLLAIDLLAFSVAEAMGPRASQMLRQTRGSIASLHGIAPQQPIGD